MIGLRNVRRAPEVMVPLTNGRFERDGILYEAVGSVVLGNHPKARIAVSRIPEDGGEPVSIGTASIKKPAGATEMTEDAIVRGVKRVLALDETATVVDLF